LRECPSSSPCRAPPCHQPAAAKELEFSPAAPYLGAPFEGDRCSAYRAGLGLLSRALPRRRTRFGRPEVPSAVSSSFWVREDRSSRPLGLGLLVTPPYLALSFARARYCSLLQSGIAIREYQRLLFPLRERLSPDRPSTTRWLGGLGVWAFDPLPRTNRSALTASTIQQLAG
jgi:hypothetical protein